MYKERLLETKIRKLDELLELDDLLIEALEKETMESIPPLMEKKFLIINEIKGIDEKLKDGGKGKKFAEQQKDKFRYINRRLTKLKKREEKLLYMAQQKMDAIEGSLETLEEIFKVKNKYKTMKPRKNIFERVG